MTFSMDELGRAAKAAARVLATATTAQKNQALQAAAASLRDRMDDLLAANAVDMATATAAGRPSSFLDRLMLDAPRIEAMAEAIEAIGALPDPVGRELARFERPNGLDIRRVAVPLGVIGMVYESRPNVGADASALALKSGNVIILRGGSESLHSTRVIVGAMQAGLAVAGLPKEAVQLVDTPDRDAVAQLLSASAYIDLVIPRGGRGLVELVRDQARVPTLLHLDGNCHVYVHAAADIEKATAIVRNAKLRRTGVCGAAESLVVDHAIAATALPLLVDALEGCEVRGDEAACAVDARIRPATDDDWGAEYLDTVISVRVVADFAAGLAHVARYSSGHTDAIITEDGAAAAAFLAGIDSAIVMHNASTQFADGGEFGMGAEIGIATGKMHARGPVGLEQLTSFKYLVHGEGQIRP